MRFYNFLNEKIESKEYRDLIDIYINNIRSAIKKGEVEQIKELSGFIRKQTKRALQEIISNFIVGSDDFNLDTSIRMTKNESIWGRTRYLPKKNLFEFQMTIGRNAVVLLLLKSKAREEILNSITNLLIHEVTHFVQWYRSQGNLPQEKPRYEHSIEKKKDNLIKQHQEYLSLYSEIEAYASEAADKLIKELDEYLNVDQIIETLKTRKNIEKLTRLSNIVYEYWSYFGKADEYKAQKVWQRFVKKLINHLEDEKIGD